MLGLPLPTSNDEEEEIDHDRMLVNQLRESSSPFSSRNNDGIHRESALLPLRTETQMNSILAN